MLRLEAVSKTYQSRHGSPVTALDGVSLVVAHGETVCLVGASGSGKSTVLRLVNRLLEPSAGRVLVGGTDVATLDPVALRRRIGYVVQRGGLFPHLTVAANLGLVARLEGWSAARIEARVGELLALVRLEPDVFARRWPRELSGGQSQRVAVARALMLDPDLLLMDEPFGALDPITRAEVQDEFLALFRDGARRTTLVVTHDLDEAFRLGDRVALLDEGHVLQIGTPAELVGKPANETVRRFLERHVAGAGHAH